MPMRANLRVQRDWNREHYRWHNHYREPIGFIRFNVENQGHFLHVLTSNGLVLTDEGAEGIQVTADFDITITTVTGKVFTQAGTLGFLCDNVPSDGSIANGELYMAFDDSPGSSALILKGRDSGGAVVTASVPLT